MSRHHYHEQEHTLEDTLAASVGFDFRKVDGVEHLIPDEPTIADLALAAIAFREVLEWVMTDGRGVANTRTSIIRLYAFMWCLHPECLRGRTQAQIAELIGCTKNELNRQISGFRYRFNFRNSRMRSEASVEAYRGKALAQHAPQKSTRKNRGRRHARGGESVQS